MRQAASDRVPAVIREYRVMVRILARLLLVGGLSLTGWAIVGLVVDHRPAMDYVSTQELYLGGRVVEWQVELVIAGESVTAVLYSEREAVRLRDAARR